MNSSHHSTLLSPLTISPLSSEPLEPPFTGIPPEVAVAEEDKLLSIPPTSARDATSPESAVVHPPLLCPL